MIANDLTLVGIHGRLDACDRKRPDPGGNTGVWALVIANDQILAGSWNVWPLVITNDPMRERR